MFSSGASLPQNHPTLAVLRISISSASIPRMLVTTDAFSAVLHALGLTQGFFKPTPSLLASTENTAGSINGTLPQAQNFPVVNSSNNLPSRANLPDTVNNVQDMNQHGTSCYVAPYDVPTIGDQVFSPFDETRANVFRYRQQQSVNLGSWYVYILAMLAYSEYRSLGSCKKAGWSPPYLLVRLGNRSPSSM